MIVKLTNDQISTMWPLIKHGVVVADKVPAGIELEYTNEVLKNLLSGKFQTWLGFEQADGMSKPYAFLLTHITKDTLYNYNYLSLESLYGFRVVDDAIAKEDMESLKEFARSAGCKVLRARTRWGRIIELLQATDFVDSQLKMFEYQL